MKRFATYFIAFGLVTSGAIGGMMLYKALSENDYCTTVVAFLVILTNMLANALQMTEREKERQFENGHLACQSHVSPTSSGYDPLKMFYEIAEKYFGSSTPQDLERAIQHQRERNDIVCKGLVSDLLNKNERLEKEQKRTKRALWLARADAANLMDTKEAFNEYKRDHPYSRWNDVRGGYSYCCSFTNWSRLVTKAERKCRTYAAKFKEGNE